MRLGLVLGSWLLSSQRASHGVWQLRGTELEPMNVDLRTVAAHVDTALSAKNLDTEFAKELDRVFKQGVT